MSVPVSSPPTSARAWELLALTCMAVGAAAWLWECLALQAPTSPWHLPGMPMAVARLATHAWLTGLAVYALTRDLSPPRWVLIASALGAALSLGAQGASAATGLLGVQVRDGRGGSHLVLAMRALGALSLAVAFAAVASQRLRRR